MIKFTYRDREETFETWYDAATWLAEGYEVEDSDIVHMIDSARHCFLTFIEWVNDNYSAYDILTMPVGRDHYQAIYEEYLCDVADDLESRYWDYTRFFEEVEE